VQIIYVDPIVCRVDRADLPFLKQIFAYKAVFWKQGKFKKERHTYLRPLVNKDGYFLTGFLPFLFDRFGEEGIPYSFVGEPKKLIPQTLSSSDNNWTLRDYQMKAIQQILKHQRGIIHLPTGSGKTVIFLSLLKYFPDEKVLIITHTQDLLRQTADRAREMFPGKVGIIGGGEYSPNQINVATIQTLDNLEIGELHNSTNIIVIDECFPKGSLVTTKQGLKPIEQIKIGTKILTPIGYSRVSYLFKNKIPLNRIIKLTLSNKTSLFCSKEHLILTSKGWMKAKDTIGSIIFTSDMFSSKIKRDMMGTIIQPLLKGDEFYEKKNKTHLPYLSNRISRNGFSNFLLSWMCPKVSRKKKILFRQDEKIQPGSQRIFQNQNESKQSIKRPKINRKDVNNQKNKWNFRFLERKERGQWTTPTYSSKIISCCTRVGNRLSNKNKRNQTKWKSQQVSTLLQSRFGKQKTSNRNRSRWSVSQSKENTRIGQKERISFNQTWVESIEIYKPGYNDKSFSSVISNNDKIKNYTTFYDLEIKDFPTYFVNGVLVHNCHHMTSFSGTYSKLLYKIPAPIRIGFTATLPSSEEATMCMKGHLGEVIFSQTIGELSDKDVLAKVKIKLYKLPFSDAVANLTSYKEVYEKGVVLNRKRHKVVLEKAVELVKENRTVLILVTRIDHGMLLEMMGSRLYPHLRIKFLHGEVESEVRNQVRTAFDNKEVDIVIATTVWKEGVDIPNCGAIILGGIGKSDLTTLQFIGRGLRKPEGKEDVIIVDFFDYSHRYLIDHFGHRLCLYFDEGWL
jgi:superfamily II DNA or RNA helicase